MSENWWTADDKTSLWNVAPNTYELHSYDRSSIKSKTKEGGVMLFEPLKFAPETVSIQKRLINKNTIQKGLQLFEHNIQPPKLISVYVP